MSDKKKWGPECLDGLCRGPIVAVVEADSHGRQALWELTAIRRLGEAPHPAQERLGLRPLLWEGSGSGTFKTVGQVECRGKPFPVNLDITVQQIDGAWVAFVAPCSLVVDRHMCEEFIQSAFAGLPRFKASQANGLCELLAQPLPDIDLSSGRAVFRPKA